MWKLVHSSGRNGSGASGVVVTLEMVWGRRGVSDSSSASEGALLLSGASVGYPWYFASIVQAVPEAPVIRQV